MNDFIFNVLQPQGLTLPSSVPLIGGMPLSSFVGSLLGVIFGFALKYIYSWLKDKCSAVYYIKLFKIELNQAKETLEKDNNEKTFINPLKERRPTRLQTDYWTSVVNRGDLRLFRLPEVVCLSRIYSQLRDYNDDVQIYITHSSNRGFPVGKDISEDSLYYPHRKRLGELNAKILDKINEVNREKWIASEHWWQLI